MDGAYSKRVTFRFGIIHCEEHADLATRDVHAYLHKKNLVRFGDAFSHPQIKPLFDILQKGTQIKRSSGLLDPGWQPLNDPYDSPNLIQKLNNDWYFTFHKGKGAEEITKSVPLRKIFDGVPDISADQMNCLNTAMQAMDDGIYKEKASEQEGIPIGEGPEEMSCIQKIHIDGVPVRVLIPTV